MDKRFIEESFPVKEVSEEFTNEKKFRRNHISTLHIWWARKPLSSSRAINYSALISAINDSEERNIKRNFIIDLSKFENTSNRILMEKAREEILNYNNGKKPKILDPFAGAGIIPLEALRLGCETYAGDYNPIAVLIEKCTLEYPQKYGKKLILNIKKYANSILEELKNELKEFYPPEYSTEKSVLDGEKVEQILIGYIWSRTIKCQNPNCGIDIPLKPQFWLAKKKTKEVALYPFIEDNKLNFRIVGTGYNKIPKNFNPNKGTISRGIVECLVCGSMISKNEVEKQFQNGKTGQKILVIVYKNKKQKGKKYRIANENDINIYRLAEKYLSEKVEKLKDEWIIDPIPNEVLKRVPLKIGSINVWVFGIDNWGKVFNSRQKLTLVVLIEKIKHIYEEIYKKDAEYAKVIVSYLALAFNRLESFMTNLCRWKVGTEQNITIFSGRQGIPMTYDYFNVNPLGTVSTSWINCINAICSALETLDFKTESAHIKQFSATDLPYNDNFFDAVFTDPPYYDYVPYSYLTDFFYVWLKILLVDVYPELFSTPLTPKSKEVVAYEDRKGYEGKGNNYFDEMLKKSFKEIFRVLKPNGIAVIVYAHKTTRGWESVINALLDSNLNISASWPVSTEMKSRIRAKKSAALASSIYIVARKIKKEETGLYPEVRKKLSKYLNQKLDRLWVEGISGADFFIAAIGAGIEIFGQYKRIIDFEGNEIRAKKLLDEIRKIVTDFVIKKILHNGFSGELSPMTRFYILWRWNYQEIKVEFDEARKLAQSIGIDLEKEWNKGFLRKKGKFIEVLTPEGRDLEDLISSAKLIDVLHYVLLLWERGESDKILETLSKSYGESEVFYRIAQAISQCLPNESKEKNLIDGFLSGKERLRESIKKYKSQEKIDRWTK